MQPKNNGLGGGFGSGFNLQQTQSAFSTTQQKPTFQPQIKSGFGSALTSNPTPIVQNQFLPKTLNTKQHKNQNNQHQTMMHPNPIHNLGMKPASTFGQSFGQFQASSGLPAGFFYKSSQSSTMQSNTPTLMKNNSQKSIPKSIAGPTFQQKNVFQQQNIPIGTTTAQNFNNAEQKKVPQKQQGHFSSQLEQNANQQPPILAKQKSFQQKQPQEFQNKTQNQKQAQAPVQKNQKETVLDMMFNTNNKGQQQANKPNQKQVQAPQDQSMMSTKDTQSGQPQKNYANQGICSFFLKGNCKFNELCTKSHDIPQEISSATFKQKLPCQYYMQGNCTFGQNCKNSHDFEIPQTEEEMYKLMEKFVSGEPSMMSLGSQEPKADSKPLPHQQQKQKKVPEPVLKQKNESVPPKAQKNLKVVQQEETKEQVVNKLKHNLQAKDSKPVHQTQKTKMSSDMLDIEPVNSSRSPTENIYQYKEVDSQRQIHIIQKCLSDLRDLQQSNEVLKSKYKEKAECVGMCSAEEIQNRVEVEKGSLSNFEQSQYSGSADLCIKKLQKSAADKNLSLPSEIRQPLILQHVVRYLRECIVDQDRYAPNQSFYKYQSDQTRHKFLDVYTFVEPRIRQITKDFVILHSAPSLEEVRSTEEIVRFLIISYHDAYFIQSQGFDLIQNTERLTMNLSRLLDMYKQAKFMLNQQSMTPDQYSQIILNRSEFTAYYFIATATAIDGVEELLKLNRDTPYEQHEKSLIAEALRIRVIICSDDCASFFKKLRSPKLNYFFACIMIIYLKHKLLQSINHFRKGFCAVGVWPFETMSSQLGISNEDTKSLVIACAYDPQNPKANRRTDVDFKDTMGRWKQSSPLIWHNEKRANRLRADLMLNGDIEDSQLQAHVLLSRQVSIERAKKAELEQQQRLEQQAAKQKELELKRQKEKELLEQQEKEREEQRKKEEEAKAEEERKAQELKMQMKLALQEKIQKTESDLDLKKREIKAVQKQQTELHMKQIAFNTFKRKIHHDQQYYRIIKFFFDLWCKNTIQQGRENQTSNLNSFAASITEMLTRDPIVLQPYSPQPCQINEQRFQLLQELSKLPSDSHLQVTLVTRPIKASTALKRLQFNQCIDGLIRLLSNNQQHLHSDSQNNDNMGVSDHFLCYSVEQQSVSYKFTFQSMQKPDLSQCGTIITVVHNQKDLTWIQQMKETIPEWIQILVVLAAGFKSEFPQNVKVVSVPEALYSLKTIAFTKLLELELGNQLIQLIQSSPLQSRKQLQTVSLNTLLSGTFDDYVKMCKYAANQVSSTQFEQELENYFVQTHNAKLRKDLDDYQIFSIWYQVLTQELQCVTRLLNDAQKQTYLQGKPQFEVPQLILEQYAEDKFRKCEMPFSDYIQLKSESEANQTKGALYRGTLHFGILLHKFIQTAPDLQVAVSLVSQAQIKWELFIKLMQETGQFKQPVKEKRQIIKLLSMKRPLLEEEKVVKRQKTNQNQTSISDNRKQQVAAEIQEINNYLDQCKQTDPKQKVAEQSDTTMSDVDYGEMILKLLNVQK